MSLSAPFFWKSVTRPGCDTDARSGGLPPSTAVERTVGGLSPVERYLTATFGDFCLKPSSTAWKCFCSSPVQTPTIETLPLTSLEPVAVVAPPLLLLLLLSFELPPQAASARTTATASVAVAVTRSRFTLLLLSRGFRHRCPYPIADRKSGVRACRRPPRRRRPRARGSGRRSARRRSPRPRRRRSAAPFPRRRRPAAARASRPS